MTTRTTKDFQEVSQHVNTCSRPSDLKITDMRIARTANSSIIRLDTNQGIYGLGKE